MGGRLRVLAQPRPSGPPLRLAHVLFVLWVTGAVAWAFYVAGLGVDRGWWETMPLEAALLILLPTALAHALAIWITRVAGNPRF